MKLLIGIPTGGSPAKPFLESLAALQLPDAARSVDRITVSGNFIPAQRELMLKRARDTNADFLAMIDDDMVLPSDAIVKLWEILDRDPRCALAGALYYSRDGLRPMAVDHWDEHRTTTAHTPAFDERTPIEVDGVGFGCVLVRVSALALLSEPFVRTQIFIEEHANRVRVCNEDYLFCASLRQKGFTVMLHPGVRCGHYDRASGRTFPQTWEPAHITNRRRMAVMHADGTQALESYDDRVPQTQERHVTAALEYIYTDERLR